MTSENRDTVIQTALQHLRIEDYERALETLNSSLNNFPTDLEILGYINLIETLLLQQYSDNFSGLVSIPEINPRISDRLTELNLEGNEGYLLSQIDGNTDIRSLIYICGMGKLTTLRTLNKFLSEQIILFRS